MARPPVRTTTFEKVVTGELLKGVIETIEYDDKHEFNYGGQKTENPGVRIVFRLDGYTYPKRTRWMKFNMGEKANLYKKYVSKLIVNPVPNMDFDLDELKNMKIKAIFVDDGEYQNIDSIFPDGEKRAVKLFAKDETTPIDTHDEEPIQEPF